MARPGIDSIATIRDVNPGRQRFTRTTAPLTGTHCALPCLEAELLRADEGDLLEQYALLPDDDTEDYPNTRVGQAIHA